MSEATIKLGRVLEALQNIRTKGKGTKPLPDATPPITASPGAITGPPLPERIRPRPRRQS